MTQSARPASDISTGSWSTAPLYAAIDEASASDSDFIQSGNARLGDDTCEISLGAVSDPQAASGQVVRLRAKFYTNNSRTVEVQFGLYQGATLIATSTTGNLTTSFAAYSYTLSEAEADAITDYADLRLRLTGHMTGGAAGTQALAYVSWAVFECPDAPLDGGITAVAAGASAAGAAPELAWDYAALLVAAQAAATSPTPGPGGECVLAPDPAGAAAGAVAPGVSGRQVHYGAAAAPGLGALGGRWLVRPAGLGQAGGRAVVGSAGLSWSGRAWPGAAGGGFFGWHGPASPQLGHF